MPKGRARKLSPKYLGPFPITKVVKDGASYQLQLSEELTRRGISRTFHASLLRPHVPNDDRRFPGRLPIQIPGFGERPEEWIVDGIVAHHGKGLGSDFLIQWKAGDKSWATYREVAHLNALDRYCELLGVDTASELPASYVSHEPDDLENEIHASACLVENTRYKREDESFEEISPYHYSKEHTSTSTSLKPISTMFHSSLSDAELRDCLVFERKMIDSRLGSRVTPLPIPPPKWSVYQSEQANAINDRNRSGGLPRPPAASPPAPTVDNVSMSAGTLETIIRALGTPSRPVPAPAIRPTPAPRFVPRRPMPAHHTSRGYGGRGGRGRGMGRGYAPPPNRRGRRNRSGTRDPRYPIISDRASPSTNSAEIQTTDSVSADIASPVDTEPINNADSNDLDVVMNNDIATFNSDNDDDAVIISEGHVSA
jgi:hypothetical protein